MVNACTKKIRKYQKIFGKKCQMVQLWQMAVFFSEGCMRLGGNRRKYVLNIYNIIYIIYYIYYINYIKVVRGGMCGGGRKKTAICHLYQIVLL